MVINLSLLFLYDWKLHDIKLLVEQTILIEAVTYNCMEICDEASKVNIRNAVIIILHTIILFQAYLL